MTADLPSHIWFVRSNGGSGSYPVRHEGWTVVWTFVAGMFGSGLAAAALGLVGTFWESDWVVWIAIPVFAIGAALSGWYFIEATRKHTDYSIRYSDYLKATNNA